MILLALQFTRKKQNKKTSQHCALNTINVKKHTFENIATKVKPYTVWFFCAELYKVCKQLKKKKKKCVRIRK